MGGWMHRWIDGWVNGYMMGESRTRYLKKFQFAMRKLTSEYRCVLVYTVLRLVYDSVEAQSENCPHHGRKCLVVEKLREFDTKAIIVIIFLLDIDRPCVCVGVEFFPCSRVEKVRKILHNKGMFEPVNGVNC